MSAKDLAALVILCFTILAVVVIVMLGLVAIFGHSHE